MHCGEEQHRWTSSSSSPSSLSDTNLADALPCNTINGNINPTSAPSGHSTEDMLSSATQAAMAVAALLTMRGGSKYPPFPGLENNSIPEQPRQEQPASVITTSVSTSAPRNSNYSRGSAGNHGTTDRFCEFCGSTTTPVWRRGPSGKTTLCNACGIKWRVKHQHSTQGAQSARKTKAAAKSTAAQVKTKPSPASTFPPPPPATQQSALELLQLPSSSAINSASVITETTSKLPSNESISARLSVLYSELLNSARLTPQGAFIQQLQNQSPLPSLPLPNTTLPSESQSNSAPPAQMTRVPHVHKHRHKHRHLPDRKDSIQESTQASDAIPLNNLHTLLNDAVNKHAEQKSPEVLTTPEKTSANISVEPPVSERSPPKQDQDHQLHEQLRNLQIQQPEESPRPLQSPRTPTPSPRRTCSLSLILNEEEDIDPIAALSPRSAAKRRRVSDMVWPFIPPLSPSSSAASSPWASPQNTPRSPQITVPPVTQSSPQSTPRPSCSSAPHSPRSPRTPRPSPRSPRTHESCSDSTTSSNTSTTTNNGSNIPESSGLAPPPFSIHPDDNSLTVPTTNSNRTRKNSSGTYSPPTSSPLSTSTVWVRCPPLALPPKHTSLPPLSTLCGDSGLSLLS
ncbi:hypothetical protein Pelo_1026 [Pelomyxa schiedti]|nr:hypothetical protein Pelo_1026 [Pelomyxa schiedti]